MRTSWGILGALVLLVPTWYLNAATTKKAPKKAVCSSGILNNPIKDIGLLHKNLFSASSVKIIICTAPLYALARGFDEDIHACFYDELNHKNTNQMPESCSRFASKGMALPIMVLGSLAFLSSNPDVRMTSYIFLLGMPFVIFGKKILKKWHADHCKRPPCEWFDKNKTCHGGFPSGHMAEAFYMTVLYGMRYGPKAWVPLGAFSTFVFASFVNCNRHYTSQMVAGAAFGAMYAVAANKLIDSKLATSINCSVAMSKQGVEVQAGIAF